MRRLGFGVSGPHGTPLVHPGATADMIYRAFDRGVRLFDTGPSYGAGEAERRLGEAMRRLPRLECIISTKAGHHFIRHRQTHSRLLARREYAIPSRVRFAGWA